MSVITRISVHTHCNELGGKIWNPAITWTQKYAVFISIENQNGAMGLGECWCFDSSPDVLVAYLRTEICPQLVGLKIDDCETVYLRLLSRATLTARHGLLASAWSGIDIALWDLNSREAGLPLWQYLKPHTATTDSGGTVHLYSSGGLYGEAKTIDDLVSEMISMHSSGFDIVKMKIGGLSIAEDLARINAVLGDLDQTCKLILDGVYSYTHTQALQIFNALPADRIEAFQSPVNADDLAGMKLLCEAGVPVMSTEAEYRKELHNELITSGAVRFLQTAPIACGGLNRLLALSNQVENANNPNLSISLEVSSTAIALLAAAHYAAACNTIAHVEYHCLHQVFFEFLELAPVQGYSGCFQLTDTPGLGIDLPESQTHFMFAQT